MIFALVHQPQGMPLCFKNIELKRAVSEIAQDFLHQGRTRLFNPHS